MIRKIREFRLKYKEGKLLKKLEAIQAEWHEQKQIRNYIYSTYYMKNYTYSVRYDAECKIENCDRKMQDLSVDMIKVQNQINAIKKERQLMIVTPTETKKGTVIDV